MAATTWSEYKKYFEKDAGDGAQEINGQMEQASKRLAALQGDAPLVRTEVDPDVVSKVVSDWTGIPLGKVMRDQARNIMNRTIMPRMSQEILARMSQGETLSLQKSEGFRAKAPRVKSSCATANPWQRRIWSPPTFLKGKKDGEKPNRSWNAPLVCSSRQAWIRFRFNIHDVW